MRSFFETYQRTSVVMTSQDNELIRIRISNTPESSHHEIFKRLGVKAESATTLMVRLLL